MLALTGNIAASMEQKGKSDFSHLTLDLVNKLYVSLSLKYLKNMSPSFITVNTNSFIGNLHTI